jgi:hypothetical protein
LDININLLSFLAKLAQGIVSNMGRASKPREVTFQQHGLGVEKGCSTWKGTYIQG